MTSVAPTASIWLKGLKTIWTSFKETGEVPYANNAPIRYYEHFTLFICCAPCIAWSCLWRVIACPYMCMCKGASFMCSDNGCTSLTDQCVEASCTNVSKRMKLPGMPHLVTFSDSEKAALIVILTEMSDSLSLGTGGLQFYEAKHHRLIDAVFKNTLDTQHYSIQSALAHMRQTCQM